jgi:hypothetical protein
MSNREMYHRLAVYNFYMAGYLEDYADSLPVETLSEVNRVIAAKENSRYCLVEAGYASLNAEEA